MRDLYVLASQHQDVDHPHSIAVLKAMNRGQGGVRRSLDEMEARGWARQVEPGEWNLTPAGREQARRLHDDQGEVVP
jgi:hypothetical protein